jgi:hypothetical protein
MTALSSSHHRETFWPHVSVVNNLVQLIDAAVAFSTLAKNVSLPHDRLHGIERM